MYELLDALRKMKQNEKFSLSHGKYTVEITKQYRQYTFVENGTTFILKNVVEVENYLDCWLYNWGFIPLD